MEFRIFYHLKDKCVSKLYRLGYEKLEEKLKSEFLGFKSILSMSIIKDELNLEMLFEQVNDLQPTLQNEQEVALTEFIKSIKV